MNTIARDKVEVISKVDEMILGGSTFEEVDKFMQDNRPKLHGIYKKMLPIIRDRYNLDLVMKIRDSNVDI